MNNNNTDTDGTVAELEIVSCKLKDVRDQTAGKCEFISKGEGLTD